MAECLDRLAAGAIALRVNVLFFGAALASLKHRTGITWSHAAGASDDYLADMDLPPSSSGSDAESTADEDEEKSNSLASREGLDHSTGYPLSPTAIQDMSHFTAPGSWRKIEITA